MDLTGFGHGVSFGVQPDGSKSYLWTEVDSNKNGYGQNLTRFEFVNGKTLSHTDDSLDKFTAVDGAMEQTCAIDTVHNRLISRYNIKGSKRFAVFDLDAATKGDFSTKLADIPQPALDGLSDTLQGYTVFGQYLYLLTGNSYDMTGGDIDSELITVDLNTGNMVQGPTLTKAGSTLSFREPEGLAVYQTDAGNARLFLGFASGKAGDRRSNLFYKDVFV